MDTARRDAEGDWQVHPAPPHPEPDGRAYSAPERAEPPCQYQTPAGKCGESWSTCSLGKGTAGVVDPSECRACIDAGENRPIRLGIISPGCYTGGAEMWMLGLLTNLDRSRIFPVGVAVRYPQWIQPEMQDMIGSVAPVTIGEQAVDALWQDCDVVLVWGVAARDQRMPPRPRRAKVVLISHGVGPWTVPIFAEPDSADGWVAVSNAGLDPIPASHKSRATVLANGVDPQRLASSPGAREAIRGRLGVSPSQRLVVYLGRVSDEKNPRAFLACAAECDHRWPGRFAFALVGDGLGWEAERAWASVNSPGVRWVGAQRNVGDWLAAADHVMATSHEEADSLTLLEAFTAGRPIVSTRVGRLREAEYADLARVVEVNPTAGTLADALDADATDAGVADRVESAQRIAMERHTSAAMAERWMAYVETLCLTP